MGSERTERLLKPAAAVIVAHPDDEVLWAGGTILASTEYQWYIFSLCRASDPDRAPKFYRVLRKLNAQGGLCDLDDGPAQIPLPIDSIQAEIFAALPRQDYALVLTHNPRGEYTRHRRHEEVSQAVTQLWMSGRLQAKQLWTFAYQDQGQGTIPQARADADRAIHLPEEIWELKYALITKVYGFDPASWEAKTTPRTEAFSCFHHPMELRKYAQQRGSL